MLLPALLVTVEELPRRVRIGRHHRFEAVECVIRIIRFVTDVQLYIQVVADVLVDLLPPVVVLNEDPGTERQLQQRVFVAVAAILPWFNRVDPGLDDFQWRLLFAV